MRKLIIVAATAALGLVGVVGRASAQTPSRVGGQTPSRVGGRYGYPSQYPTYPQQYPTTSQRHHDKQHKVRNDGDRDDDDNANWGDNGSSHDRGRHNGFDHSRHSGYNKTANGVRSREKERDWATRDRSRRGDDRDDKSNRHSRDRG